MKKSLFPISARDWLTTGKANKDAPRGAAIVPDVAISVLNILGVGVALFSFSDRRMIWCNAMFRKQTWFGVAPGGKRAKVVSIFDLFSAEDHGLVRELVRCAEELGFAHDPQRALLRGPTRTFLAEVRLHNIGVLAGDHRVFCLEFFDLSKSRVALAKTAMHAKPAADEDEPVAPQIRHDAAS